MAALQHIRFKPDPLDHALLDLADPSRGFAGTCSALIVNESFSGCALVIHNIKTLAPGKIIRVKVGRLEPMQARIVWIKPLDQDLIKLGIQFLE